MRSFGVRLDDVIDWLNTNASSCNLLPGTSMTSVPPYVPILDATPTEPKSTEGQQVFGREILLFRGPDLPY